MSTPSNLLAGMQFKNSKLPKPKHSSNHSTDPTKRKMAFKAKKLKKPNLLKSFYNG